MPKYRVTFGKSAYAPDGETITVDAPNERLARDRARGEWISRHRYYGSSHVGRKWEDKARRGYSRASKPKEVTPDDR